MSVSGHRLLVNALTFSRVPLIFLFAVCAVIGHFRGSCAWAWAAAWFMFLSAISDLFDGKLARKWQVVTTLGKLADPLMDKVFFIVAFPVLLWMIAVQGESAFHGVMMLAFTVSYILRDVWVTFLRAIASAYRADVAAMWLGKVRTALSFPAAGLIYLYLAFHGYLPDDFNTAALYALYGIELALIVLNFHSCAVYTHVYFPYMRRSIETGG